jgi:hypothetical protein
MERFENDDVIVEGDWSSLSRVDTWSCGDELSLDLRGGFVAERRV